ncbi:MAG: malate synthase A [Acidobacteriota bacterium]
MNSGLGSEGQQIATLANVAASLNTELQGEGIEVLGEVSPVFAEILTPAALRFVAILERRFRARRAELLERRVKIQADIDRGWRPNFLAETRAIRESEWRIGAVPEDLRTRVVEITGPVQRNMVINAFNSGANVYMADFEDAHSPTWDATIQGQINIRDAINRRIDFVSPAGKRYALNEQIATLMVRPRGWHLSEKHLHVDSAPVSGSLFDFGLFFFHNARTLLAQGTGPYFYLPKMENHLEARLWNDVFICGQEQLGIERGTIKATVLIETILAAFEMDEILYELREHITGLNCGRWDYIFSFIKKFRNQADFLLPDRALVTMNTHFLKSYSLLLIKTCHRRGAHAMGGMAAQIPIKNDPEANAIAMQKVRADKEREVNAGHDGTWVAHPDLVAVARESFDAVMTTPNQLHILREDVEVKATDLLSVPTGPITEAGLRTNINVGLLYLEAWLKGSGCVPLYNLMEDAATAEISRAQVWQWLKHGAKLADGRLVTPELVHEITDQEVAKIRDTVGEESYQAGKYELAREIFEKIMSNDEFIEFLTLPAYDYL